MPELAPTYAAVFAGPPWNETWSLDEAVEEIQKDLTTKGFIGVQAQQGKSIVGFTWGFPLPNLDQPGKQFSYVRQLLAEKGIDPNCVFYGTETGVLPESQKQGIGRRLLTNRMKRTYQPYVTFRTKNPLMLKVYQRVTGPENVRLLCRDPDDPERIWYLIRNDPQDQER